VLLANVERQTNAVDGKRGHKVNLDFQAEELPATTAAKERGRVSLCIPEAQP
jgi:hypothetical protein